MGYISKRIGQSSKELVRYKDKPKFVPTGQSTQMIVGASDESDLKILNLTEKLYKNFSLKRVFFSAYVPVAENPFLPALDFRPPLLREHRLYQADWLLRFYHFQAAELLDETHQNFNPVLDPKCNWALCHPECFPVEVNKASYETLLRVPGIGLRSAQRIILARRTGKLDFFGLKKLGVVLKRAQYFITCEGKFPAGLDTAQDALLCALLSEQARGRAEEAFMNTRQLSLFENPLFLQEELHKCLSGQL